MTACLMESIRSQRMICNSWKFTNANIFQIQLIKEGVKWCWNQQKRSVSFRIGLKRYQAICKKYEELFIHCTERHIVGDDKENGKESFFRDHSRIAQQNGVQMLMVDDFVCCCCVGVRSKGFKIDHRSSMRSMRVRDNCSVLIPLHLCLMNVSPSFSSSLSLLAIFQRSDSIAIASFAARKNGEINAHDDLHNGKCFDACRIRLPQPTPRHHQLVCVFFVDHHHAIDARCGNVDVRMCDRV